MSMPRRQIVLLGVFFVLFVIGAGYAVYNWGQAKKHEAHWDAMFARGRRHQQLNPSAIAASDQITKQQADAAPAARIVPGSRALIEPIRLLWKDSQWEGKLLFNVDGCLPIAADTDLVWHDNDLFLMKEPGRLERLWSDPSGAPRTAGAPFGQLSHQPCFDGRYIWVATGGDGPRRLMVIDPRDRKATEFGSEASGLFNYGAARNAGPRGGTMPGQVLGNEAIGVSLAPVRPGVVCAFFAARDSWLALLHFDAKTEHREVEPIELPPAMNLQAHREQMFALDTTVAGQPTRRIVVGRDWTAPLVLDPDSRQVNPASGNSSLPGFRSGHWCIHDGAVWWQRKFARGDHDITLCKAILPELKEQVVVSKVPPALLASTERGLLLVGDDCWLLQPNQQTLERLDAECVWTFKDRLEPPTSATLPITPSSATSTPSPAPLAEQEKPPIAHDFFSTPPDHEATEGRRPLRPKAIYRSAVYGLLVEVSGNFVGWSEVYHISLDGTSRGGTAIDDAANDDEPARPVVAGARQPAATTSRLTIAARGNDPLAKSRPMASLAGPVEPDSVDWHERLPVLARELTRQSLLLAAATEFHGASTDEVLGESPDEEVGGVEFQLASWFRDDGVAEVSLRRINAAGTVETEPIWRESLALLNDDGVLDYRRLAEAAERWSRDDLPKLLRAALPDATRADNGAAAPVPAGEAGDANNAIERNLASMSFLPQFAAVRACASRVSPDQSEHRLGGLVRGYANLGLLTEHHWTMAHKVFQARALLYAHRWVAHDPASAAALWHRAYAQALAGLPASALDDIAKADELHGSSGTEAAGAVRPAWVDIVAAACRCDDHALNSYREHDDFGQLAGLLRFLHLSRLQTSVLASEAAKSVLERQPDCDRASDAMCDCCLPEELRKSTAAALAVFQERLPARLREMPGLPASVQTLAAASEEAGLAGLAGRLAGALLEEREVDGGGLSWQALGSLVHETLFLQCWRRAHLFRFQLGDEADEFLASAAPLVARHPFRRLLDFYGDSLAGHFWHVQQIDEPQRKAAAELLEQIDLARLNETQQRLFNYFIGKAWQIQRPEQYAAAVWRPAQHRDDVVRDLLDQIDPAKRQRLLPVAFEQLDRVANIDGNPARAQAAARRLQAINPGNPDALAAAMRVNPGQIHNQFDQLFDRYQDSPQVLRSLAIASDFWQGKGYEALRAYIKLSPDAWAYDVLARSSLDDGDMKAWQSLLDEYLAHVPDDEQATAVRLNMANVLVSRGQWETALPYALAAAAKKSEAAMSYLIWCYQGLGDDEQEGVWHERLVERYPSAAHSREHYLWSRRTGLGDSQALADRALVRIGQGQVFAMPLEQTRYAAFYWLSHRLDDAVRSYQLAADMHQRPGTPAFSYLCIALLNEEKGDAAARDEALAQLSDISAPEAEQFRKVGEWLAAGFAAKALDVDAAQQLAASAPRTDQPAVNYLIGYALLLSRQSKDGVPFLQTAATLHQGATAPSRTLAAATLRDRGLNPGRLHEPTE